MLKELAREKHLFGSVLVDMLEIHNQEEVSMSKNRIISTRACLLSALFLGSFILVEAAEQGISQNLDVIDMMQKRHRLVPSDDIWWATTGEQMAWMHKNVHQLFPTVNVYRSGQVKSLEFNPNADINQFPIETADGTMSFASLLQSDLTTTLGLLVLHKGKIVFESYPRMKEYEKPIYWSVTKVMPAMLVRLLEERGVVDVEKEVDYYIPELAASDFAGIKIRHILDMSTGLDCQDEYQNRQSCYYQYSMAIGDGFREESSPDNPYDFLKTLKVTRHGEPGEQFSYSGVNTFVLAWLVEKITGEPFQDTFTKEVWNKIGAESDASFLAYRYGIPLTHGGFLSNMRDMARFGLLFTPSYKVVSEDRIVTEKTLELLLDRPNPNLIRSDGSHNIYQWDYIDQDGFMIKGGWGGQALVVNPKLDIVAVYTSYFKDDYSQQNLRDPMLKVLRELYLKN